ncbi:unnamed protein product [Zymoseptoria tritici ST99CH_1A5]|uniref:Uncharacterized protein n=1 Tax=Zymoseptoria tritici ST99CH_1A5 TaxID=1276529 RepID=A0A1Y6LX38_ZYMTR|nr:unnamed protein product [Zymoseptoria tritici ST99CH_1A5]
MFGLNPRANNIGHNDNNNSNSSNMTGGVSFTRTPGAGSGSLTAGPYSFGSPINNAAAFTANPNVNNSGPGGIDDPSTPGQVADVTQLSVLHHLGQFFPDPASLLAGMAKANLILSGSRAVEVFFPGSCAADSDLDFYVDSSARCVGEAIRVLNAAGVVFDPPFQPALDIANLTTFTQVVEYRFQDKEQLRRIIALPECPAGAIDVLEQLLDHLDDEDEFGRLCVLENGIRVHLIKSQTPSDYGHTTSLQIITGRTTLGPAVKVQLIFAPGKSVLTHVFDFYATCVQAVITGYGAVHLYSGIGRRAMYWFRNTQHQKSAEAAMLKYSRRGYTFEVAAGHMMRLQQLRAFPSLSFDTPRSKLVLFEDLPQSITPELYSVRQTFFSTLTWMEHNGETLLLSLPTKVMRDVLADERRKRVVLRANGIQDDSSVHIASSNSVFFKAPGHGENGPNHRYPDEIVGF